MSNPDLRPALSGVLVAVQDLPQDRAVDVLWLALDAVAPSPKGEEPCCTFHATGGDAGLSCGLDRPHEHEEAETDISEGAVLEACVLARLEKGDAAMGDLVAVCNAERWKVKAATKRLMGTGRVEKMGEGRATRYGLTKGGA